MAAPTKTSYHAERFVGPTEVTDAHTIEAICRFRASVWRASGTLADGVFADGRWHDEFDDLSRHWIITRARRIVAAGRLSIHDRLEDVPEAEEYLVAGLRLEGLIAAPGRLVVCQSVRGQGLASRILDVRNEAALDAGAAYSVAQATPEVSRTLIRRGGWRHIGPARTDPRFPGVVFHIMLLDFRETAGP
jgi:hypothetical protein